ncbi:hypothetical protein DFQ26_001253 [Actinomortierella ambigua]|nr:hypothetical protein DFQ26_001253 [Actinomortierella ambigua]
MTDTSQDNVIQAAFALPLHRLKTLCPIRLQTIDDGNSPVQFERIQFLIKPAFAMTITKAQGLTFNHVGATSKAFTAKVEPTKTVDSLKKLIKAKKPVDFANVDANNLTLWRVSYPFFAANNQNPVHLSAIDSSTKLNPGDDIAEVFAEVPPKKTISIIVQPPLPAPAQTTTSPIQPRSIQNGDIEKELAVILNGIQHQSYRPPDARDIEMFQKEQLGPFFKTILPYHRSAREISLLMLGLELDKKAKASNSSTTLHSIVENDALALRDYRMVAMVAPSGSGKTATVIDLATKHFVIYCVCSTIRTSVKADFEDPNFIKLAADVEKIYQAVVDEGRSDQIDMDFRIKERVGERTELEFLARLLFLQFLFHSNPNLDPHQFFREQTSTEGHLTIGRLIKKLREYDSTAIHEMLDEAQINLRSLLAPRRLGLVIAVDEAQVAEERILAGKLISPSALTSKQSDTDTIFDSKSQIRSMYRRGFLTPLSATLSRMRATLVILGTALSLQNADRIYSGLDKTTNFIRITDFPQFDENDINIMISGLIDLSDCEIPLHKRRKLSGRARFSLGIISRLAETDLTRKSKQAILNHVIDLTIEHVKYYLRDSVQAILVNDRTGEASRLLYRMVLASHLGGGNISFSSSQQSDFVDRALCRLQRHPDGVHLIMDEPMVIEAVEEELAASGKDPIFSEYLDQLYQLVAKLGASSTTKGSALEMLICRSLQRFNGVVLKDLPFLQIEDLELPAWCSVQRLQIDEIKTANGFGFKGEGMAADVDFLATCPPNKLLVPQYGTRPDGLWFFPEKQYAGSLAIKFYSDAVPKLKNESNTTSSDVRTCFLQADGKTVSKSLAETRTKYEKTGTPSDLKGILRIHVVLPRVSGGTPITCVKNDPATCVEDVMVYIDLSNMDSFFDESIEAYRDEVVKLKKLIRFVSSPKPSH